MGVCNGRFHFSYPPGHRCSVGRAFFRGPVFQWGRGGYRGGGLAGQWCRACRAGLAVGVLLAGLGWAVMGAASHDPVVDVQLIGLADVVRDRIARLGEKPVPAAEHVLRLLEALPNKPTPYVCTELRAPHPIGWNVEFKDPALTQQRRRVLSYGLNGGGFVSPPASVNLLAWLRIVWGGMLAIEALDLVPEEFGRGASLGILKSDAVALFGWQPPADVVGLFVVKNEACETEGTKSVTPPDENRPRIADRQPDDDWLPYLPDLLVEHRKLTSGDKPFKVEFADEQIAKNLGLTARTIKGQRLRALRLEAEATAPFRTGSHS